MRVGQNLPKCRRAILHAYLHRSLHCPVIIKTKSNDDDPNYDEHSPYRDALVDYVKENDARVVFDLHQLSSEREAAFILGTADGKNLRDDITLSTLCRCLEDLGIGAVLVDEVFKASGPNTVAASTAKRKALRFVYPDRDKFEISLQGFS